MALRALMAASLAAAFAPHQVQGQEAVPPTWRLMQTLRIDANREDLVSFSRIAVGPAGEMAISQREDGRLVVFDSTGKRVATMGRNGSGPGEFDNVGDYYGWAGDSLWAFDTGAEKLLIFSRAGRYIRQDERRATGNLITANRMNSGWTAAVFRNGAGRLVYFVSGSPPGQKCPCVVSVDSSATATKLVATKPLVPDSSIRRPGGSSAVPFGWNVATDFSSDGSLFAMVFATEADRASSNYRVVVLRASGDTVFNRRYQFEPQAVPNAERDPRIASLVRAGISLETLRSRTPTVHQPFTAVRVGRDRSIWVELRAAADGIPWLVLDPTGTPIGRVKAPTNVRLDEMDAETAWAVATDADGLRHILRYSLNPPR